MWRSCAVVMMVCVMGWVALAQEARDAREAHWTHAGWGGGGFYWACAFHPTKDGVIYLGGDVAGVYKSEDHGKHWRLINNGLVSYAVYSMAVDPTNPDTVYAGTELGLCKSTDAGEHWTFMEQTGTKAMRIISTRGKSVHSIAVDPTNGQVLYAGTPDGRIVKSADGGKTWTVVHELQGAAVASVACGPNGKLVMAATEQGVLRSSDAGATWEKTEAAEDSASVVIAGKDGQTIYAAMKKQQVMKSVDGGATWARKSQGIDARGEVLDIAADLANPDRVVCIGAAGWDGDCYRSDDGGRTWAASRTVKTDPQGDPTLPGEAPDGTIGLSNPRNIAINPRNGDQFYIAANWRPCYSDDGGKTWQERIAGADISCVFDIQFLAGKTYATAMDEGVLVSADAGRSWKQLWPRKWDRSVSGHQWRVLVWDGGNRILTTSSPWDEKTNQVLLSGNAGQSFQTIRTGLPDYLPEANTMWGRAYPRALAASPADPNTIYMGMDGDATPGKSGGGIFKSVDGGKTWKQLANQPGARRAFFALAVDLTDPQRLYWGACGERGGLYRSEDGGESWELVFTNETWPFNVLVAKDGTVYCPGHNLWRSRDHGKTWQKLTDRNDGTTIVGLEVDPRNPDTIWFSATTWSSGVEGGVYQSKDAGKTWQDITGDLPCRKPLVLRFNPETNELWAGGVGLFKLAR